MTNRLPMMVAGSMVLAALVGCGQKVLPTSPNTAGSGGNFSLSGTVVEGQDGGGGLEDVTVLLAPAGADLDDPSQSRTVVTDETGAFRADGLAAGSWTIAVTKRGYAMRSVEISLNRDMSITLSLFPMEAAAQGHGR